MACPSECHRSCSWRVTYKGSRSPMAATAQGRLDTVLRPLRQQALSLPQVPDLDPSPGQREKPLCSSAPLVDIAVMPVHLERTSQETGPAVRVINRFMTSCSVIQNSGWTGGAITKPMAECDHSFAPRTSRSEWRAYHRQSSDAGHLSPESRLRLPQRQSRGDENGKMCFVPETHAGERAHWAAVRSL